MHGIVPTNYLCMVTIYLTGIFLDRNIFLGFRHRAATTGSVGFIGMLLESATPSVKVRLNTADRVGEHSPYTPYQSIY